VKAEDGMDIECESGEVFEARKTAVELLLSDHLGDCYGPCHRVCPVHMDIPRMLRQIRSGDMEQASATVRADIPLAGVVSRLCHRPCESGCRRGEHDEPVAIRRLVRHVTDWEMKAGGPRLPARKPASGKKVAIIGAGPAGLSAAFFVLRAGHGCAIFDRNELPGGSLLDAATAQTFPLQALTAEIGLIREMGAEFRMQTRVGADLALDSLRQEFDACLIATGKALPADAEWLGLPVTGQGLEVHKESWETARQGVFAAGNVVRRTVKLVHAVAEGKAAAACIHQYLSGLPVVGEHRRFSSHLGKLKEGEIQQFLLETSPEKRQIPAEGSLAELSQETATAEAARCLRCDCRATVRCKLLKVAERYGAKQTRYPAERRHFQKNLDHPFVVYEPGKCIRCGNCISVAERFREPLGLTFVGRGFDVRLRVPFGESMARGLQRAAEACVPVCPTGALAFKDEPRPR
jgi:ferredoxin